MLLEGRRVLFISYNGMLEPLGQTQVLPYLRALAKRGVKFTLLSFEKPAAFTPEGERECAALKQELSEHGIEWHWLPYHQRPSLPATIFDVRAGLRYGSRLVQRNKIQLVHARSYIPATIALALKRKFGIKMIFDVRGLMAEEYVDAEHWPKGGLRYRITKATERRILAATDAVVTLTERIWPIIKEWEGLKGRNVHHEVIPCCVDLARFKFDEQERARLRTELKLDDRLTLVYSGSLDGWYLTEQMADFFASVVRKRDDAHVLWLTKGSHERVRQLMASRGISEDRFSIRAVAPSEMPSNLAAGDVGAQPDPVEHHAEVPLVRLVGADLLGGDDPVELDAESAVRRGEQVVVAVGQDAQPEALLEPMEAQILRAVQLGLPYYLFSRGLQSVSLQEASLIALIEPVLNPLWVALVVGEIPATATVTGGSMILAGLGIRYVWPLLREADAGPGFAS